MNIYLHLSIHLLLSILAGYAIFRFYDKKWVAIVGGVLGGFFIDVDHFIDYFLILGWQFRFDYFLNGWAFAKSDHVYIFFHSWELVLLLLAIFLILKKGVAKTFILALTLGMCVHLFTDYAINKAPTSIYFITHRAKNNFEIERLVSEEEYQEHLEDRELLNENSLNLSQ